jgi:hypothetical protein
MSHPCVWAVSDEQVLGPNRYLESEERAKAFKAPVLMAISAAPISQEENYTNQIRSSAAAKAVKAPTNIAGCIDTLNEFVIDIRSLKSKK